MFAPWHPPAAALDHRIPFLPWTVWACLSHIALLFTGWWYMVKIDNGAVTGAVRALFVSLTTMTTGQHLFVAHMPPGEAEAA